MFGIEDIPKFFLAFFLVLPIISFVHESGHVFFAWLMGAKNIKVVVGSGDVLFRKWILEVRKYYFWYGLCTFDNLKRNERFSNILIFSGGALFNAISAVVVIYLINNNFIEPGMVTYQFTYFSMYYIFFALLPMPYPGGSYSDGKIILDLIRNNNNIKEKIFRIHWDESKNKWCVMDYNGKLVQTFQDEEEALEKAHEVARNNRPSRLINSKSGEEKEVRNYPRIPL
ncbi:hypothetical protein D770_02385 [Flammeovirgaceae bacterium 311]|nr:hypothetical protein D770_02385 [Flammeovirgaceae bacterium 311]